MVSHTYQAFVYINEKSLTDDLLSWNPRLTSLGTIIFSKVNSTMTSRGAHASKCYAIGQALHQVKAYNCTPLVLENRNMKPILLEL